MDIVSVIRLNQRNEFNVSSKLIVCGSNLNKQQKRKIQIGRRHWLKKERKPSEVKNRQTSKQQLMSDFESNFKSIRLRPNHDGV